MKSTIRQSGFILSTEAILILAIIGIGLLIGIASLRDAIFKYKLSKQDNSFIAADSTDPGILIGNVIGFDQHETPLVPFIDYDPRGNDINYRALIGIRDDRFTSRQPVFYSGALCTGNPCLAIAGSENADELVTASLTQSGSISFLYALQGAGPTYGVGAGTGGNTNNGALYRQDFGTACASTLVSMWESQLVTSGSACVTLATLGADISGADLAFFQSAEEVDVPGGGGTNVLDGLTRPYITNMVLNPSTDFISTAPGSAAGGEF